MQINSKQNKGEGERGLLAKLWSGSGDTMVLAKEDRNFEKSSLAICLFIQPHLLIPELPNFSLEDGLFDRFLLVAHKPHQYRRREVFHVGRFLSENKN